MNKFSVGNRVWYRVYPSGLPNTKTVGTVVAVQDTPAGSPTVYVVEWGDVDYAAGYRASEYRALDLMRAYSVAEFLKAVAAHMGIDAADFTFDHTSTAMIHKARAAGMTPTQAADGLLAIDA
jgi:hypothetical protein